MFSRLAKTKSLTNRQVLHVCMLFRQIQVILAEFRSLYSAMTICPAVFGLVIMQIALAFLWIDICRIGKADEQILLVAIGILCSVQLIFLTLFIFGNLGKVYGSSTLSREEIRTNKMAMRKKQYRKFVIACPLLKVNVGDQNFLEPSTPLLFEEVIVDNLIGVLSV